MRWFECMISGKLLAEFVCTSLTYISLKERKNLLRGEGEV